MTGSSAAPSTADRARWTTAVLVVGAIAISLAGILVRVSEIGPAATGFFRFVLALPFLWLWMALTGARASTGSRPRGGRQFQLIALGGLFLGLDLAVWNWAIHLSSVSNATLLGNAAPIWVALAGWLFFHERFTWTFFIGLALAIIGIGLLLGGSFSLSFEHALGDVLGVAAGALWGAYIMTIGRLRGQVATATIMFWSSVVCCPVLLAVALVTGEDLFPETAAGWLILLALALVCQVGGQSLVAWAVARLPSSFASVALLLNPVSATILAWALLHEPAGLQQIAGGIVVLIGILLARARSGGSGPAAARGDPAVARPDRAA